MEEMRVEKLKILLRQRNAPESVYGVMSLKDLRSQFERFMHKNGQAFKEHKGFTPPVYHGRFAATLCRKAQHLIEKLCRTIVWSASGVIWSCACYAAESGQHPQRYHSQRTWCHGYVVRIWGQWAQRRRHRNQREVLPGATAPNL
ncbi:hypothetical protein Scep_026264 [Stephania cephalantha]|uniref:Uncharacterized protein n=1 Tax=Stephania cephalantha TaxID=152367 RepID=A0AAP0EJS9_9MAGN